MKSIAISSITIAVLGAILTWLFLLETTGPILFWAALVGWACFVQPTIAHYLGWSSLFSLEPFEWFATITAA